MITAIIGVGSIGGAVAGHLVGGGESVLVADMDTSKARALADDLGPNAQAASMEDAISGADAVVLALWLDDLRNVIPQQAQLLDGKVVIDPSNPIGFDANGQGFRTLPDDQSSSSIVRALLPAGAHYVKAFGTLAAEALAGNANREPRRAVLLYATDDDGAATTIERLIRAAGFDPFKVGSAADAGQIEAPPGAMYQFPLNGQVIDLEQARDALSRAPQPA